MTSLRIKTSVVATVCLVAFAWSSGCSSGSEDDGSGDNNLTAGTNGSGNSTGTGASGGSSAGSGAGGSSTAGNGAGGTAGSTGIGGSAGEPLVTLLCGDTGCQCENGIDDDGDGQTDGFDTECTGPLDDDEGTFATGISGDNKDPKWQDCFFDGNSGAGDDQCRYHTNCLLPSDDPNALPASDPDCLVNDFCLNFCAARTPNGCDCFGCCEVDGPDGTRVSVYLKETCSAENISDETACPRCEPSTQCGNTCGDCELCLGKTVEDLPSSCFPDGGTTPPPDSGIVVPPPYTCNEGTVCSETIPCGATEYCSQGCCIPVLR